MTLRSPKFRLLFVLSIGLVVILAAVKLFLAEPKLRQPLQAGMTLASSGGRVQIEISDLIFEPGEFETRAQLSRFYERQDEIRRVVLAGSLSPELGLSARSFEDMTFLFWIPVLVGLGALGISGWIWALKPKDPAIRLFALSGFSTFISAVPSAVYTTREVPMASAMFKMLQALNVWGASLFGIAMLSLFLIYPVKLRNWKQLALGQALFFVLWSLGFSLQIVPDFANVNLLIVILMLLIAVAVGVQFFATKGDPTGRASLLWLGLSVLLGAGGFVVFSTVPSLMGLKPLNQSYAFTFFLIIYLGLAAGLTRYRLFEVGQWAFRFLFYATAAVVLVLIDAALIYLGRLERLPALEVSLLLVVFLYLPLRDFMWRLFSKKDALKPSELLSEVLHIAFASSLEQRQQRWEVLLHRLFDPLEMKKTTKPVDQVSIGQDGLTLEIPSVARTPALILSYPWAGKSLFDKHSKKLAEQLLSLLRQAESNREAYDRGASEERRRMAQDLHDDVGARLLSGLQTSDENVRSTIQGALSEIRAIVSGILGERISLSHLLADIRYETHRRLTAVNIRLEWSLQEDSSEEKLLDYREQKTLRSAFREIVTNVIRHSEATTFSVEVVKLNGMLNFSLKDDGRGIPESVELSSAGYGLKNMHRRMSDIQGVFHYQSSSMGTIIYLRLPYDV
ncbi:MAG: hypothetical protein OM95_02085 [Bdellovibrio sp. ArHS]|uniref:sensor histidine kinase n=1 Tax=Bdellovibrio sp. ArHS TaxID=1569284 RepID=UPI000583804E|nr:ATP-binding protein [Bdellovibrio sp. ArHS]KHD89868.1 MAG: hypothetical protein OM95_02085 [Bdellovibrio sp. ArHS]